MCIAIVSKLDYDVMNFEVNLIFQGVFPTWPKSRDKNVSILRTKTAFKMKPKAF